jgi:hypothetical protein
MKRYKNRTKVPVIEQKLNKVGLYYHAMDYFPSFAFPWLATADIALFISS